MRSHQVCIQRNNLTNLIKQCCRLCVLSQIWQAYSMFGLLGYVLRDGTLITTKTHYIQTSEQRPAHQPQLRLIVLSWMCVEIR